MKKLRMTPIKILVFTILICGNILLFSILVLNNKSYVLAEPMYVRPDEDNCKEVYYDPYSIFSYRRDYITSWIMKDGTIYEDIFDIGTEVSLSKDSQGYILNYVDSNSGASFWLESEEDYNYFKNLGISEDENNPTILTKKVGSIYVDTGYEFKKIENDNDILGQIRACKEYE